MKKVLLGIFGVVALAAAGVAGAVGPTLESLQASSGTTTLYKDIRRTDQLCDRAARTWQSTGDTTFTMTEIITNSLDGARAAGTTGCFSSVRSFRWVGSDLLMFRRQLLNSADEAVSTSQYNPGIMTNRSSMRGRYSVWQNISTNSIFTGTSTSSDTWTTSYSTVNRNAKTDSAIYPGSSCGAGRVSSGDLSFSQTFIWCEGEGTVIFQERQTNATGGVLYNKTWVKY